MHSRNATPLPSIRLFTVALALLLAALTVFPAFSAHAQDNRAGLAISPPSYELSANPGDTITNTIRVDNLIDQAQEVTVSPRNFTALGEEGQVNLTEEDSTYSLAKWITIAPAKGSVAPKESQEFTYTIKVPANAEPGGRFGSIVFKTTARPLQGQSGVAVGQEIGSLLFLKIAGNVQEKSSVADFKAARAINEYKPVPFEVRVKNEGNVHLRPKGTVTITNIFGKKVATVPLESRNVLPDAVRKMTAEWKDGGRLIFGRYTATVSVVYGSDNQIATASTTFWGFPYTIMLVILGALILLGGLAFKARVRLKLALRALSGKS
ncbi:MAG TPA: DUF916 domain-containing protein [Candidatus Saccharimonadales bacterium]|nr:DUF916 domain-containing protein [Candidatus Saccharimonadales bacterium]